MAAEQVLVVGELKDVGGVKVGVSVALLEWLIIVEEGEESGEVEQEEEAKEAGGVGETG